MCTAVDKGDFAFENDGRKAEYDLGVWRFYFEDLFLVPGFGLLGEFGDMASDKSIEFRGETEYHTVQ